MEVTILTPCYITWLTIWILHWFDIITDMVITAPRLPAANQLAHVTRAPTTTKGTKYADIRSAKAWIRGLDNWAPSTSRTIWRKVVSLPILVAWKKKKILNSFEKQITALHQLRKSISLHQLRKSISLVIVNWRARLYLYRRDNAFLLACPETTNQDKGVLQAHNVIMQNRFNTTFSTSYGNRI